jgi:hypothetical protein
MNIRYTVQSQLNILSNLQPTKTLAMARSPRPPQIYIDWAMMGIDVEVFLRTLLHSLQSTFYLFVLGLGDAWFVANNPRWGRYRFLAAFFWPLRKKLKGLPWSEILRIFQTLWNEGSSGMVRRRDSDAIRRLSALVDKTFDRETRREITVCIDFERLHLVWVYSFTI